MEQLHEETSQHLPDCVSSLQLSDKSIYLIGTAHVSKQSIDDVSAAIKQLQPDAVCVELCWKRYHTMLQEEQGEEQSLSWKEIIFSRRIFFNIAQAILMFFYKHLGRKFETKPGAEMLEAIHQAEAIHASIVPVDRDVEITLNRAWKSLTFLNKVSLLFKTFWYFIGGYGLTKDKIEEMRNADRLEEITSEFANDYPALKQCMIDERDHYMAQEIFDTYGTTIIAVLGAGHIPGIKKRLNELDETKKILFDTDTEQDEFEIYDNSVYE